MGALKDAYEAGEFIGEAELSKKAKTARKLANLTREYPLSRSEARDIGRGAAREAMMLATPQGERTTHHVVPQYPCDVDDLDQLLDNLEVLEQKNDLHALCESFGVAYPASQYGERCEIARLKDAAWWGRKIRVADWRDYELRQIRLGRVRHFVSHEIAQARTWHRQANLDTLENLMMIRDDGQAIMSIADLMRTSTAHLPIRRAETIVRTKGLAEHCHHRKGQVWSFLTLTAPSKYHRLRIRKDKSGHKVLVDNPKWHDFGGPSPRDTQNYLNNVFQRIRSKLARLKIDYSIMRTAEPHADGTPHWHLIAFCSAEEIPTLKAVFEEYALEEDGDEPGAAEHRFTAEDWDPEKGDMVNQCVSYILKYVAKNIDGNGMLMATDTQEGVEIVLGEASESARRVEAWATTWGIRQFQFIGAGKVTGYRELRRLRAPLNDIELEPLRQACDVGDYGTYIASAERTQLELWADKALPTLIREARANGIDIDTENPSVELADIVLEKGLLNKWGEPAYYRLHGVIAAGRHVCTREHSWRVVDSSEIERVAFEKATLKFHVAAATGRADALALAPGSCSFRAAKPRGLGPVSVTVRGPDLELASNDHAFEAVAVSPPENGPPEAVDWYQVDPFGIDRGTF